MKRIKRLSPEVNKLFESKVGATKSHKIPDDKAADFVSEVASFAPPETEGLGDREAYLKAACELIGVPWEREPNTVYHNVGSFQGTSSVEAVNAFVQVYRGQRKPYRDIFNFEEYLDAIKRVGRIQGQLDAIERHKEQENERWHKYQEKYQTWLASDSDKPAPSHYEKPEPASPPEVDLDFLYAYDLASFKPNLAGYLAYIVSVASDLYTLLTKPIPLLLKDDPNRPQGYILGTPGSGKSELLKLLIHTYVTHSNYGSVVVVDPTSDFVTQIARWQEFNTSNRLVYIRPTLAKGMSPVLNPFELHGVEATDYSEEALNIKRVVAQELVEALGHIVSETGSRLSGPMTTILTNCVLVLLDRKDATLVDLANFMKKDKCEELIAFARSLSHHEYLTEYFSSSESGFGVKINQVTKDAIARRLDDLLSVGVFRKLTCGKSTVQLEQAVAHKKVILFDLGKGAIGSKEGSAFGRLVIAMLLGMAYRRENQPKHKRVPCTLVVDECQNFVTNSMSEILAEARKYRLFATFAQQIAGQRMPIELKESLLQNTNLQVVGGTTRAGAKRNADLVGIESEDVVQLDIGEFYTRPKRSLPAIKFKTRDDLLDWKNCVSPPTWKRMVFEQVKLYYQHQDKNREIIIEEEPDVSPQDW